MNAREKLAGVITGRKLEEPADAYLGSIKPVEVIAPTEPDRSTPIGTVHGRKVDGVAIPVDNRSPRSGRGFGGLLRPRGDDGPQVY